MLADLQLDQSTIYFIYRLEIFNVFFRTLATHSRSYPLPDKPLALKQPQQSKNPCMHLTSGTCSRLPTTKSCASACTLIVQELQSFPIYVRIWKKKKKKITEITKSILYWYRCRNRSQLHIHPILGIKILSFKRNHQNSVKEQRSDLCIVGANPWEMPPVEQQDPYSHNCRQNNTRTTLQYKNPRIYKPQLRLPALIHRMRHSTERNYITLLAREIAMVTHHSLVLWTACFP